ncbi:cache domain-containing sensor histidine kinase [Paenibacillus glycanilyticus]|uniref:histidine kinase n=1 Tax=Paenibacillus glycanilyticus TaxID=126569 RepID=A0ABQ6G8N9_9BACL|nr:sensor histidine kinase [Paenibacillus glycanilyticus]GLX66062.1 histidine kinase [Paenibacillus glycanilyticus]
MKAKTILHNIVLLFSVRRSIQAQIFVSFLALSAIVLSAVTWIWYFNTAETIKHNAIQNARSNIVQAHNNLEIVLKDFVSIITLVSIDRTNVVGVLERKQDQSAYIEFQLQKKLEDYLGSLFAYKSYITAVSIIGFNGEEYNSGFPYRFVSYKDKPWFQDILAANGKPVFFKLESDDYTVAGTTLKPVLVIGRTIKSNDKAIGVALLYAPYDIIRKVYDNGPQSATRFIVSDKQDQIIFESNPGGEIPPQFQDVVERDGQLYVKQRSAFSGWTTIGAVSVDSLIHDTVKLRNQMFGVIGLALVAVLFVSIIISRRITKNLRRLRDRMVKIDEGNLKYVKPLQSKDEVGHLSQAFSEQMGQIYSLLEEVKRREQQKRKAEIKALQSQIDPHFLYNTLNTIQFLAQLQQVPNIREVTTSLIELLRDMAKSDSEYTSLEDEITNLERYVNIQSYRLVQPFTVHYEIEEEARKYLIPRMLVQPLLENALIHGIEPVKHKGMISVKMLAEGNRLTIAVTDNGAGIPEDRLVRLANMLTEPVEVSPGNGSSPHNRFSGLGVMNVAQRIRLLFGREYGLRIYSQQGLFTTTELTLPIIHSVKEDAS